MCELGPGCGSLAGVHPCKRDVYAFGGVPGGRGLGGCPLLGVRGLWLGLGGRAVEVPMASR